MQYVDGIVIPVSTADQEAYAQYARELGPIFKEYGALQVVDCWGDDVPEGKLTSFPMAVKREPHETVVFSWIVWPSRAVRDAGWEKLMADPRMKDPERKPPFDGKRMIYGGFQMVAQA